MGVRERQDSPEQIAAERQQESPAATSSCGIENDVEVLTKFSFVGQDEDELSFAKGQRLVVLPHQDTPNSNGWLLCCDAQDQRGLVPKNYLWEYDEWEATEGQYSPEPAHATGDIEQSTLEPLEDLSSPPAVFCEDGAKSEDEAAPSSGDAMQRAHVINEIVETERDYVDAIQMICDQFLLPLKNSSILSAQEVSSVFANLESILELNQHLLSLLKKDVEASGETIARAFLEVAPFLKMYAQFLTAQSESVDVFIQTRERASFAAFLHDRKHLLKGMELNAYLLKPVQRICKYPLLFRELLKRTPEDHPERSIVIEAFEAISAITMVVNEHKRAAENRDRMVAIHASIVGINVNGKNSLFEPTRYFIAEGNFTRKEGKQEQTRHYFLFNDILVLTKRKGARLSDKVHYNFKEAFPIAALHIERHSEVTIEIKVGCTSDGASFTAAFASTKEQDSFLNALPARTRESIVDTEGNGQDSFRSRAKSIPCIRPALQPISTNTVDMRRQSLAGTASTAKSFSSKRRTRFSLSMSSKKNLECSTAARPPQSSGDDKKKRRDRRSFSFRRSNSARSLVEFDISDDDDVHADTATLNGNDVPAWILNYNRDHHEERVSILSPPTCSVCQVSSACFSWNRPGKEDILVCSEECFRSHLSPPLRDTPRTIRKWSSTPNLPVPA